MNSRTRLLALALLGIAVAMAVGGFLQLRGAATTPGPATADTRVQIPAGASLRSALRVLESQGYLTNARFFEWYLRCCHGPAGAALPSVKAGRYELVAGSTPLDLLQQLVEGRVILEQITLVEGWTFAQFRSALAADPHVGQTLAARDDRDIMAALDRQALEPEGRFAPDTYRFEAGTPDLSILRMALVAQEKALAQAWEARAPDLPLATPDEALVLASIVEKETGLAAERAQVASVFVNRLRKGMRLQSDPTVIYGIRDRYDGNIRRSDLIGDTPYNTYTRAGLPPTPIAMPGRDALWATTHPAPGNALYFVAIGDGSGGHTFSSSLEEHNRAVQRYVQRQREQSRQAPRQGIAR